MSNEEFLRRLEAALTGRVPQEEVDDALNYHREYFAEAGENAANEIPAPEVVAEQIIRERDEYLRKRQFQWARPALVMASVVGVALLCAWFFAGRTSFFRRNYVMQTVDAVQQVSVAEVMPGGAENVVTWGGEYLTDSVTLDPFESIAIEGVSGNVTITSGDEFTLYFEGDERETLSCFQDNGVLHITGNTTGVLSTGLVKGQIVITVPSWTQLSLVSVKTEMGNIYLSDIDHISEVDLTTELGDIDVNSSMDGKYVSLRCQSDLGNISLNSVRAETLNCQCDAGSIQAIEFSAKETTLQADMGSITAVALGAREDYEMDLSVELGRISVDGQQRLNHYTTGGNSYLLTAKADAGNITLDFVEDGGYPDHLGDLHEGGHHLDIH